MAHTPQHIAGALGGIAGSLFGAPGAAAGATSAIGALTGGGAAGLAGATAATGGLAAAIPLALGAAQGIGSLIKGAQARRQEPPREDIEQRQFLSEIQRQRRGFQTGVAFRQTQRALRQTQASASRGALRTGRGDLLARLTRGTQTALGEAAAKRGAEVSALRQMEGDLIAKMSQRRLDLQRIQQSKAEAQKEGLGREAKGNILGALAQNVNVGEQQPAGGGISEEAAKQIQDILNRGIGKNT